MKLDVWQRLRGVRYAIFQVDLARSLAAGHSLAISFARTASGSIAAVRSAGRFFLFLGVGDLTRNLLGYKFVK